ncbi:MAG: HAMP domain-containing histidine kinase [Treponema sp.]|nr:HAMP domain-containing histidine kinase [Treponema sp.]
MGKKSKFRKIRFQIFLFMGAGLLVWSLISNAGFEILFNIEEKNNIELPEKVYVIFNCVQVLLLVLVNIPFLRFLIRHLDKPVQKIITGLKHVADGNYSEKIEFNSKNEFDEIKDAFNLMAEKLEQAEQIKLQAENERILLFANMAHDLKTPITSIIGFAKALSDDIITDEQKKAEYMHTIHAKATKMNELIDRLFEYVKLESAENLLHKEKTDISELLRNCIADMYTEYEENNIALEIEIPENAVIKEADKVELSRVYTNLLNNVLKHNPKGIKVLVRMEENGRTTIADSGEKMSEKVEKNMFMPFVSGDSSRTAKSGSGLGLALAHIIVAKHGGTLRFVADCAASGETGLDGYTKAFVVALP